MDKTSRDLHDEVLGQWASDLEDFFDGEIEKQEHYHLTNDSGREDIVQGEIDILIEEDDSFYIFEVKRCNHLNRAIKQLKKSEGYLKAQGKPIEKYVIIKDMIYLLK